MAGRCCLLAGVERLRIRLLFISGLRLLGVSVESCVNGSEDENEEAVRGARNDNEARRTAKSIRDTDAKAGGHAAGARQRKEYQ